VLPASLAGGRSRIRFNKGMLAMIATALAATTAVMLALPSGDSNIPEDRSAGSGGQAGSGGAPASQPSASQPPAAQAPKVVATFPANGAVVTPGPFRLAVTFDREMAYPECAGEPQLSADSRTYTQECTASAPGRYVIYFNRPPYIGFVDAQTRAPAEVARLEFTVRGEPPASPKVVSTSPADGSVIQPGPFTVSVTFDRPMLPDAMSVVRTDEGAFPDCRSRPQISADGRTWTMECVASAPGSYVMYFNRPPYMNFRDGSTRTPAEPARLQFTVAGD